MSEGQQKAKPVGVIVPHTSQLINMKFDMALKQFKQNMLISVESEHFFFWKEVTAALLIVLKKNCWQLFWGL